MNRSQGIDFRFRISGNRRVLQGINQIRTGFSNLATNLTSISRTTVSAGAGIASIGTRAVSTVSKIGAATTALVALYAASRAGGFAQGIIDADVGLNSLRISLEQASGSAENADREIEFLRATARRFGVEIAQVAAPYAQFANAITASGGSLELARNSFLGVTQAGLALGSTSEQISRVLRQLQQAASKNRITLEDLGTAAESLPGAIGLLAQSLGITTAELAELTAAGELEAIPALEKFGSFLQNEFAAGALKAAQDVQSSQARFRNAFLETRQQIAEGGFASAMQRALDRVTASTEALNESGASSRFGAFLGSALDRVFEATTRVFNIISRLSRSSSFLENLANAGLFIRIVFSSLANIIRNFFSGFAGVSSAESSVTSLTSVLLRFANSLLSISNSPFFANLGSFVRDVFNGIVSVSSAASNVIAGVFVRLGPVISGVLRLASNSFNSFSSFVSRNADTATSAFQSFLDVIVSVLSSAVAIFSAFQSGTLTFNVYQNVIIAILNTFRELIILASTGFGVIIDGARSGQGALQLFAGFLFNVFDQFSRILETFNGRNSGLGDNFIAPGISSRASSLVDIISFLVGVARGLGPVFVAAFDLAIIAARNIGVVLLDAFNQVRGVLSEVFGDIDVSSVLADIALLFRGADASEAANSALEPLFQIRDIIGQLFNALVIALPVAISIGSSLLVGFVAVFNILNNQIRPVLDFLAQLIGFDSFLSVLAAFKVFSLLVAGVSSVVTSIVSVFSFLGGIVTSILGVFVRLRGVVTFIQAAIFLVSSVLGVAASTVLIALGVFVAIGAAVFLIFTYWEEIVGFLSTAFDFVVNLGSALLNGFADVIRSIPGLFLSSFDSVSSFLLNWSAPGIILRLLEAIFPGITQGLVDAFGSAVDSVRGFFSGLWDFIDRVIFGNFRAAWDNIRSFFGFGGSGGSSGDNSPRFATGGPVSGPGTGRSDSIRAWLSNGEYVINANATKMFRPLLDLINYGKGGSLRKMMKFGAPAFANGGFVGTPNLPNISMPNINVNGGGGIDLSRLTQVHGRIDGNEYLPGVPTLAIGTEKEVQEAFRRMGRNRVRRGINKGG